jgi:hypothetical protein
MQAPTTLIRGRGLNRMTAGAIGLTLLVATAIGAVTLSDHVTLPSLGRSEQAQKSSVADLKAEMLFLEQNSFDYAVDAPPDAYLSRSVEESRFIEENIWQLETPAQPADREAPVAPALDYADMRFLEQNIWETQRLSPDITTLNLDRDGADVVPAGAIGSVAAIDVTTLDLDRDGADVVPAGR